MRALTLNAVTVVAFFSVPMPRLAPRPIVARPSTPSCVTPDAGEPDYFYSDEAYPEDDANFRSMDADLVVAAGDVEGTMADLVAEFEAEAANLDEAEAAALWQRIVSAFESEELRAYKGAASAPSKSDAAAVAFSWANAEGGAEAAAVLALENSVDEALLGAVRLLPAASCPARSPLPSHPLPSLPSTTLRKWRTARKTKARRSPSWTLPRRPCSSRRR